VRLCLLGEKTKKNGPKNKGGAVRKEVEKWRPLGQRQLTKATPPPILKGGKHELSGNLIEQDPAESSQSEEDLQRPEL